MPRRPRPVLPAPREIDLVEYDDVARRIPAVGARGEIPRRALPVALRVGRDHQHAEIGRGRARPGTPHALLLDRVGRARRPAVSASTTG